MTNFTKDINVIILEGLTLTDIQHDSDTMLVTTACGRTFRFYHEQDCCESVRIHDIKGSLADVLDSPILSVVERIDGESWPGDVPQSECCESYTWTTFMFRTAAGVVIVRWLGESNGYYGEGVSFIEVT